ncbi:MAG TPA: thiol reductant ABC exporter subunit CydD [Solirubrobacteraceae bacterium]|nr:thiol reductant ABC exporter subunit CydD [Solirubrobacteraceae bacterium]
MRALDPRLLRYARATRTFLFVSVALGSLGALLIVAQAWLLADVVARAFIGGRSLAQLRTPLTVLLTVVVARAVLAWAAELAASRSSARAKSQLRTALLERIPVLCTERSREQSTGELAVLATRGIDALDGYFSLYLPQLFLAVIVPVVVIAAVLSGDWISAAILAFTIPLIPLFMALVGATTRERMDRQFQTLERLAGHFLDVVAGLPTLKVFGRARAQAAAIREIAERYRQAAMSTLRVTFLSSLILELVATIAVALVAVAIGLRLMDGHLDLRTALFALVLAPEAFLPLRRLGANYHASAEGMAAAERVFAVLETPSAPTRAHTDVPDPAICDLTIDGLRVTYPGRSEPAFADVSLTVSAGETLALVGPSGCGKSTLLSALLGLLRPDAGSIQVGEVELAELDPVQWRARLAWVPQRPHLFHASIADNVRLGRREASDEEVRAAIFNAGLADAVAKLPAGLDTILGDRGAGLSAGERQRLALARAFLRDAPLLLLDEPTAGLDGHTEQEIVRSIRRLAHGRTVVLVAHRPALVAMADRVFSLVRAEVAA